MAKNESDSQDPVPSPLYPGERARVRGRMGNGAIFRAVGQRMQLAVRPFTPALSPEYRGEGGSRFSALGYEAFAATRLGLLVLFLFTGCNSLPAGQVQQLA